jgi:hypothetical protein
MSNPINDLPGKRKVSGLELEEDRKLGSEKL